jgi:hypothetical protein
MLVAVESLLWNWGPTALLDWGLLFEVSRSHSDTQRSIRLLWASDRPVSIHLYLTTHDIHFFSLDHAFSEYDERKTNEMHF